MLTLWPISSRQKSNADEVTWKLGLGDGGYSVVPFYFSGTDEGQ